MAAAFDNLGQIDSRCSVNGIFDMGLLNSQKEGRETMPGYDERRPFDGLAGKNQRWGWLAHRTAGAEGFRRLTDTEGEVPKYLTGTLDRICLGKRKITGSF